MLLEWSWLFGEFAFDLLLLLLDDSIQHPRRPRFDGHAGILRQSADAPRQVRPNYKVLFLSHVVATLLTLINFASLFRVFVRFQRG